MFSDIQKHSQIVRKYTTKLKNIYKVELFKYIENNIKYL